MLDLFTRGIASLARPSSDRSLPFARDASGGLRVRDGRLAFDVVRDAGAHRRRLHTATLWDAHGRRGYLRRAKDEAACVTACEAASALVGNGAHLASVPCRIAMGSHPVQVPCALALTRKAEGLAIELLPHTGAIHLVRPAFIPNLLSGTLADVGFRAGSTTAGHVMDVATLIQACIDGPGILDEAERAEAEWGVVMATVLSAGRGGPDAVRDRRSVDILREHDRITRRNGTCPDRLEELVTVAASHLTNRAKVWAAMSGLPQAEGILDLAQGHEQGFGCQAR